jgi:short-subunit dehydrogenase
MSQLQGKVVWVTGASSGIGEALVYELVRHGARLIISARRKDELERVKGNCQKLGATSVEILPLDLSQINTLSLTTEVALQFYGQVDILVNNGGISQRSLAKETALDVDRRLMEVNYFGTITLTKNLMPHLITRGHGHIVNITSVTGLIGTPYRSGYAASKHALHGFFNSLRAELWKDSHSIYVTLICPGWTNTNLSITALKGDGTPQNKKDDTHATGLSPEFVAKKIIKAIKGNANQIIVGGWKETMAVYVNRFSSSLFARIVRSAKVK